jgi:hypothetical protein
MSIEFGVMFKVIKILLFIFRTEKFVKTCKVYGCTLKDSIKFFLRTIFLIFYIYT